MILHGYDLSTAPHRTAPHNRALKTSHPDKTRTEPRASARAMSHIECYCRNCTPPNTNHCRQQSASKLTSAAACAHTVHPVVFSFTPPTRGVSYGKPKQQEDCR